MINDIGAAIKELRKTLGNMTQERLAHHLGTSVRTISRWEAAEALAPPILSRLESLAITIGARDAADFFKSRLAEENSWKLNGDNNWRCHVANAQHLLALARLPVTPQTKSIGYLYDSVVEITDALTKLEAAHDEDKHAVR